MLAGPEAVGLAAEKNRRVGSGRGAAGVGRENNTTPLAGGGGWGEAGYILTLFAGLELELVAEVV